MAGALRRTAVEFLLRSERMRFLAFFEPLLFIRQAAGLARWDTPA